MAQTNTVFGIHLALCGLCHYAATFPSDFQMSVSQPSDQTWSGAITTGFCLSFRCSRFQSEIKRLKISSPVRVCQNCYYNLQHERGAEDGPRNCWRFTSWLETTAVDPPGSLSHSERHQTVSVYTSLHTMLGVLNSKGSLDKRVKNTVTGQTLFRWPAQEE